MAELLAHFDYDAHLLRAQSLYASRADALVSALRHALSALRFREPDGGFSVFVETGEPGDDAALLARAAEWGVSFDPGRLFRATATGDLALRLCYSVTPEPDLWEAIRRLARVWEAGAPRARH